MTEAARPDPSGLLVERLGIDGAGRAGSVRLPFTLPGETVQARADGTWAVAAPVPERVAAPCPHFGTCGGCVLQHASDGFVAAWKREIVVRALAARGIEAEVRPVLTSPPASRRRAVLAGRRTKGGAVIGLHHARSAALVDLRACPVVVPEILAAKPWLARVVQVGAARTRPVRITATAGPGGLDVAVEGGKAPDAGMRADLAAIAAEAGFARMSWDGETVALARPPVQLFGRARVVPPPGGFLQATADGEAALVACVTEIVGPARRVGDLYAGCGTFALPLAERCEVLAVEGDAESVAALDGGWRGAPGLRRIEAVARDLARRPLQPSELKGLDAVVVDPPRAGAEAQCAAIAASEVPVVAAVSCNPVSFARDAAILRRGGFRLDWVQPIDQFRWSAHVELVAAFRR